MLVSHANDLVLFKGPKDNIIIWSKILNKTSDGWQVNQNDGLWTNHESYRKTYNIRPTLVGNKIVNHSDVVGASPDGAAPTTSSLYT